MVNVLLTIAFLLVTTIAVVYGDSVSDKDATAAFLLIFALITAATLVCFWCWELRTVVRDPIRDEYGNIRYMSDWYVPEIDEEKRL